MHLSPLIILFIAIILSLRTYIDVFLSIKVALMWAFQSVPAAFLSPSVLALSLVVACGSQDCFPHDLSLLFYSESPHVCTLCIAGMVVHFMCSFIATGVSLDAFLFTDM